MPQRSDQELVSWDVIGGELGMTGGGTLKIYNQTLRKIREHLGDNPAQAEARPQSNYREKRNYRDNFDLDSECEKC